MPAWNPRAVPMVLWTFACLFCLGVLYRWHGRERAIVEDQANTLVHAVANTLRALGGRVARSEGLLNEVFREVVKAPNVSGIALVDADGKCVASLEMPELPGWQAGTAEAGTVYRDHDVLVWDTVDVGQCYGGGGMWGRQGRGGRGPGRQFHANHPTSVRLFVSMPLASLRARWRRDVTLIIAICVVLMAVAIVSSRAWTLARRSAGMMDQLAEAEKERRGLAETNLVAAGIAHEIKNPLGVIRGTVQRLVSRKRSADELNEALPVIINEIDRITSRINELLSFSRPNTPARQPLSLREQINDVSRLLAEDLSEAGLTVSVEDGGLLLDADPEQFRRLAFNLMHNAIRFAPGSGKLKITAERLAGGSWQLDFLDHGPGIAAEDPEDIFVPYYTTAAEGTGLGMAVARRIALAHGWTIRCESPVHGGTRFRIAGIQEAVPDGPTWVTGRDGVPEEHNG